jgi:hypothetical protein
VASRQTHCKRGHELWGSNVEWSTGSSGKPQRSCRACHKMRWRERYQNDTDFRESHKARKRAYMRVRRAAMKETHA